MLKGRLEVGMLWGLSEEQGRMPGITPKTEQACDWCCTACQLLCRPASKLSSSWHMAKFCPSACGKVAG